MTSTTTTDAAGVLAVARGARAAANQAEAQVLASAVEWAHLHQVDDLDLAATVLVEHGKDTGIPIAGEGAPLVSQFAVAEFAAALGLTAGADEPWSATPWSWPTGSRRPGPASRTGPWHRGGPDGSPRKPCASRWKQPPM